MTQEAKIIGIVKELQAHFNTGVKSEWWQAFDDEMMNHFPKLAEAILIAVDALEKIKEKEYSSDEDDLNCAAHHACCDALTYKGHMSDCEIMNALSKISSL